MFMPATGMPLPWTKLNVKFRIMSSTPVHLQLTIGLLLLYWSLQISTSNAQAPPPVTCAARNTSGCTVTNYLGLWPDRSTCKVAKVSYPTNEQEILAAVADAVRNGQKLRVVSKGSHSMPKLVCPGSGDGSGVLISTRNLTKTVAVDSVLKTVTVDAGVQLKVLFDTIARFGLAFPHSPYWSGLSISGVLGTGAHGSSLWGKGSAVHEYVVGMRLVVPATASEGYAKVITLVDGDEDLNAAKVSLGLLGVISTVTLQLQPMFKRQVTFEKTSDADIEGKVATIANTFEFGDVDWYPSQQTVYYRHDNRVNVSTNGVGTNNFTGFRPLPVFVINAARIQEEFQELTDDPLGKCLSVKLKLGALDLGGQGWTNNGEFFRGWPVTGYQNSIQCSGTCQDAAYIGGLGAACAWDHRQKGELFFQTGFSINIEHIVDFISDVKAIVKNRPSRLCSVDLFYGILMRFVKNSSAYLGEISSAAVDLDITYYRAPFGDLPRLNEDAMEEIEQLLIFKYSAKPHWGKNRPIAFQNAARLFPNLPAFLAVKQRYDPGSVFSNDWTDAVLNVSGAASRLDTLQPYCALEGLCICSEDVHCAPEDGYFCRPGTVYQDARVCRYVPDSHIVNYSSDNLVPRNSGLVGKYRREIENRGAEELRLSADTGISQL